MHPFDVLSDPVRRRALELIAQCERASGDVVAVIQAEFGITQSAVSQHLRVLRESGFAVVRKEGAKRCYSLDLTGFRDVDTWLSRIYRFWDTRLEALATEVARGKRMRRKTKQRP